MMCRPLDFRQLATPLIARLFASVEPLVQTMVSGLALRIVAACAGLVHSGFGGPPKTVPARRGVSEGFAEVGAHCLEHARIDGRGGVEVEINWKSQAHSG